MSIFYRILVVEGIYLKEETNTHDVKQGTLDLNYNQNEDGIYMEEDTNTHPGTITFF